MTFPKALFIVVATALSFSVLGGAVGFALGRFVPGYYRSVFMHGDSPDFDPLQVGLGLGITQGLMLGTVIGLVIVVILVWHNTRIIK